MKHMVFGALAVVALAIPRVSAADINWSGPFSGVNIGYAHGTVANAAAHGVAGGAQLGYNYQLGRFVFGVEGDFDGTSESNSVMGYTRSVPWIATARSRVGYAAGPLMLYATVGPAWNLYRRPTGGAVVSSGWAGGGGVEWMVNPRLSLKVEYLRVETSGEMRWATNSDLVRLGANFHF